MDGPPGYVCFGMVCWRDDLPDNPLQDQVNFAADPVWHADQSLFEAYTGATLHMDPRYVVMEFLSRAKAARFMELWYKTQVWSVASKASATVKM